MKKVVALFLLALTAVFATMFTSHAAEGDLIDLYPYDQIACLEASAACTKTKLGDGNWDMEFAGHRYHFVRDTIRFVSQFDDKNSDGFYVKGEYGGTLAFNAFAVMTINNTDAPAVLTDLAAGKARADITDTVHRMYSYFDADGKLQMFEDHVSLYYIFNDGTAEAPDWRLATNEEKAAWDAAAQDAKPVTTRNTHIRMKLDATDSNGYKLEPIKNLKWTNADVDDATATIENLSTIIVGDPTHVTIPSGWTVVSFGTNDRDAAQNAKTVAFIKSMPTYMINNALAPMEMKYTEQAPLFSPELLAADDDKANPGINIVIDYNAPVVMPDNVYVTYVDMYDAEGNIVKLTKKVDYVVEYSFNDAVVETITYTYNSETNKYDISGPNTVVNSQDFGKIYQVTFRAINPEFPTLITEVKAELVIGVMPPKFVGVKNVFGDENIAVDLLAGISADNGYGVDISDLINVSYPANFNPYNPTPGEYKIDLTFTYNVFIEGVRPMISLNGTQVEATKPANVQVTNFAPEILIYTDVTNFKTSTFSWGSSGIIIEVGGDGKIIRTINRTNWDLVDINGKNTPATMQNTFATWLADLTLEAGGFLVVVGRTTGAPLTAAAALLYDQAVSYDTLTFVPDVDEDFVKNASYTYTIDDVTAPVAIVVNNNYKIVEGQFTNVNQAILANIVAVDNVDGSDVAMFVSNNGGLNLTTVGVYTVEVTLEDEAGNSTIQTFSVTGVNDDKADEIAALEAQIAAAEAALAAARAAVEADIAAAETALAALQARLDAAEAALTTAQAAIEVLQIVPETGCGSAITGGSALFITLSLVLGTFLVVFLKKRS